MKTRRRRNPKPITAFDESAYLDFTDILATHANDLDPVLEKIISKKLLDIASRAEYLDTVSTPEGEFDRWKSGEYYLLSEDGLLLDLRLTPGLPPRADRN